MNDAPEIHARPKIIGARIKRTEDPRLLTGLGAYTDDRQVMRVLHVAFRRSDQSHARIRAIDCAAARAAPGVVAVFTADDLTDTVKPLVATSRMANYYATPILPLARGKVRYVGEPVVGIVAESRYQAEDALELIDIDYEPLPIVIDPEQAVRAGAPLLHDEAGTNVLVSREFKRGDVEAAFASAPVRVQGRFRMHRKTPVAIEPRACLAEYDAGPRRADACIRPRRCPASCAMRWRRRSIFRGTAFASSRPMSAAVLAAKARSIRRKFLSAPRRGCWRARSNGPATAWKTSPPTARVLMKSSTPNWRSTTMAASWRCAPTSSATSAPIRSIRGPRRSSRSRW